MYNYLNQLLEYITEYEKLPNEQNEFNKICLSLYNKQNLNEDEINCLDLVLKICNIVYENTSSILIDDDFYDQLVELYRRYNPNFRIGSQSININDDKIDVIKYINTNDCMYPIMYNKYNDDNMMFFDSLYYNTPLDKDDLRKQTYLYNEEITKRKVIDSQLYPSLVGTLDKCKFVLDCQAKEKGVYNEPNVKIFERDFFAKHLQMGLINKNDTFTLIAELKYDGISVCAEVKNNVIISANTRGDVKDELSADLTPIFAGYRFNHIINDYNDDEVYGVKFEAIITKYNLMRYNKLKGRNYANGRTAIIGLLSSSDAYKYRDFITLIPLDWSFNDELTENANDYVLDKIIGTRRFQIECLNKYRNGEINRYAVLTGNYVSLLYQVKRFVEEAEMMRDFIPYMYDGVVISYDNPEIRQKLGRENNVNKYSIAVKFSALKKSTTFIGYSYTVGQDGTITPMIHFNPVVFFGTVHDKASGHSYARFKELELKIGDVIDVEYTNDVMAYVTKPDNSHNANNMNPLEQFPSICPSCGSKLFVTKSGKSIKCENLDCPERNLRRIDNMFKKLNIKDFSEAYLSKIGRYHLKDLLNLTKNDVLFLGEVNSSKFEEQMTYIKTNDIYDYKIIGSLGFNNVGSEKWKIILSHYNLHEFIKMINEETSLFKELLTNLKGLGPGTINTIFKEYEFFEEDILYIASMTNVKSIKEDISKINVKKIRFTGVRDSELINFISSKGHDISGGSLTKDTDILIVPYDNYSSSKVTKALSNGNTIIVSIENFKNNIESYLE